MDNNLMGQLSYKQFLKSVLLMFPAVGMYAFTMITGKMDKNNLILSLFLMLLYALVYVIALYIVFTKYDFDWTNNLDDWGTKVKKGVVYSIYEVRMAIRLVILMYAFTKACQTMMVYKHSDIAIIIPLVVVMVYLAGKGLRGYICFMEAIFWEVTAVGLFIAFFCFKNADIGQMTYFAQFHMSGGVTGTLRSVLLRGYAFLIVFSMMEFVMLLYVRVKNRKRGMLISAVGLAVIISGIAGFFVIAVLGLYSIASGMKNILNIVGAFEFPNGNMGRLGILACFLLMSYGIVAMQIHAVVSFDVINGFVKDSKKNYICRFVWAAFIIILYLVLKIFLKGEGAYEFVLKYMAIIDIPLSIILPALLSRRRFNVKKAAQSIAIILLLVCCSGCKYESIEDVDYATVIILEKASDRQYNYTFVVDTLSKGDSGGKAEETIWNIAGDDFGEVCDAYDKTHNNTLDLSHIEYIVVKNENELCEIYSEFMEKFQTKYVNVIYEENLIDKAMGEDIREYLAAHYDGKCLAAIDIYDEDK